MTDLMAIKGKLRRLKYKLHKAERLYKLMIHPASDEHVEAYNKYTELKKEELKLINEIRNLT